MSDTLQHTLDELIARYTLEPSLRDIYVEGAFDREVLEKHYYSSAVPYEIDTVEIPFQLLATLGLTDGNKQRVIALARALSSLEGDLGYRCLVDRDLDHWYGQLEKTPRLIWTAYCSIETYFLTESLVTDFMKAAKAKAFRIEVFWPSFTSVLRDLYLMRLADRELRWSMKWLPPDRLLKFKRGTIEFDSKTYIQRLLIKNGKFNLHRDFEMSLDRWNNRVTGDIRSCVRGHDFVNILAWSIGKMDGLRAFAAPEALERLFVLMAGTVEQLSTVLD